MPERRMAHNSKAGKMLAAGSGGSGDSRCFDIDSESNFRKERGLAVAFQARIPSGKRGHPRPPRLAPRRTALRIRQNPCGEYLARLELGPQWNICQASNAAGGPPALRKARPIAPDASNILAKIFKTTRSGREERDGKRACGEPKSSVSSFRSARRLAPCLLLMGNRLHQISRNRSKRDSRRIKPPVGQGKPCQLRENAANSRRRGADMPGGVSGNHRTERLCNGDARAPCNHREVCLRTPGHVPIFIFGAQHVRKNPDDIR